MNINYARILDARTKLQNNDMFTNMAKESTLYAERFKLVEEPKEYYTIISLIDMIEFTLDFVNFMDGL